jgi:N-acyl amino acid synthase of PEP-CTERM/exosortase system
MSECDKCFSTRNVEREGSNSDLLDSFRFRYRIFCLEENFLTADDYPDRYEYDRYDALSEHISVYESGSDALVGYVRLVRYTKNLGFPTAHHYSELYDKLSGLPLEEVYEISRLCISPMYRRLLVPIDGLYDGKYYPAEGADRRGDSPQEEKYPIVLTLLLKAMYQTSINMGGGFWVASMEPGLIRYLSKFGLKSIRLADDYIDFHGKVMPCLIGIDQAFLRMSETAPELYEFFVRDREAAVQKQWISMARHDLAAAQLSLPSKYYPTVLHHY